MIIDKFLLAQCFGFVAFLTAIISVFQKKRSGFIWYMILQSIFLNFQYFFLDKIIATCVCLVSIIRLIVYSFKNRFKQSVDLAILICFVILNLTISIITFESWYDIFPLVASTLVCYTIWQNNIVVMKAGLIISKILWLIYASISLAYFSILTNIFVIIWTTIYLIINYKLSKRKI